MANLPDEYNTMDFGFSMEDPPSTTPVNAPVDNGVRDQLQTLEYKLDNVLSMMSANEGVEASPEVLLQLERLVMPLLLNLQKNPEKQYINWPNREEPIQQMIDKLLLLTRGE